MGDHDGLFKHAFSVPEHAAAELRSVLPPALAARIDLSRLTLLPGSFVGADLAQRHTDLLFRAPLVTGGDVHVNVLFEHLSTQDRMVAWRALSYVHAIWAATLRKEPGRRMLPPVVTVVVYHGDGPWSAPRRLHELVEGVREAPELARFVPAFELVIDDLTALDDDALRARPLDAFPRVVLWALRDSRAAERFLERLLAWAAELEEVTRRARDTGNREDADVLVRYIHQVAGERPADALRSQLAATAPTFEASMASLADLYREEGLQQGREEGLRAGHARALRQTLLRLLGVRFGAVSPELERRIDQAEIADLERWLDRVVTASSLAGVFDDA